ncbi:MAG: hypothetical protein BRD29_04205 [Bacteroidetes bacterium QH_2_67_10]|nr:MAG: hypothetical protein BRD29_04205 [Bacteroidetes bacterium QH_2_67_10]
MIGSTSFTLSRALSLWSSILPSGKEIFLEDQKARDATLRRLQTPAESTTRLSEAARSSRPGINWSRIAGFGNVVTHDYLGLDHEKVWNVVRNELPELKSAARALLREREEEAADDDKTNE